MTRVKICGINDAASFDTAVEAGADWLGFVFFPASPRYVTPANAAVLSRRTNAGPLRVGLFVQPTEAVIAQVLDFLPLDILQIYDAADGLEAIKQRFGLPVWRPIAVSGVNDLPSDPAQADMLVLEAKAPPGSNRPGGNATRFDWPMLRDWTSTAPWILAGGLTPGNVGEAIQITRSNAVDVSSGVESSKGVKDPFLIRAFIATARASQAACAVTKEP